ncbi:MAG: hypothetical protein RIC55_04955 [Pirellulaceae bacterium]
MTAKLARDCPACGQTFGSVVSRGVCPKCGNKFDASPTHIALAGRLGKRDPDGLLAAIAAYHHVPCYPVLNLPVSIATADKIPELVAREHCLVPVIACGEVRFAIPDPMISELSDLLGRLTGAAPRFAVAPAEQIRDRLNEVYGCIEIDSATG